MNILDLYDISIDGSIPDGIIFEPACVKKDINLDKKDIKSKFTVKTNETFYNKGIIGKIISMNGKKSNYFCGLQWY